MGTETLAESIARQNVSAKRPTDWTVVASLLRTIDSLNKKIELNEEDKEDA